jgi:hypothetical protein
LGLVRRAARRTYSLGSEDNWRGYRDEGKKWKELGNRQPATCC